MEKYLNALKILFINIYTTKQKCPYLSFKVAALSSSIIIEYMQNNNAFILLRKNYSRNFWIYLHAFDSERCKSTKALKLCIHEAKKALKYKSIINKNKVIWYSRV